MWPCALFWSRPACWLDLAPRQLPTGWAGAWKAIDNTFVPVPDVETWRQFYTALAAHDQANFIYSQALKALADQATTEEQATAIHWGMAI